MATGANVNKFLFYEDIVPLDRSKHTSWCIKQPIDYAFAMQSTFVPIMLSEIADIVQELPIVLVPLNANSFILVAIMGLDQGQNLMIDNGAWTGRYVPAILRRYPFITLPKPNDSREFLVAIDAKASCLTSSLKKPTKNTQKLFDGDEPSKWLMDLIPFLERCHTENILTLKFTNRLKDLGLLTKSNLSVKDQSGGNHQINGAYIINQNVFQKIPAETIQELFANGWLEKIYQLQFSLKNFPILSERISVKNLSKVRVSKSNVEAIAKKPMSVPKPVAAKKIVKKVK